ncbi:MAG: hypothetical protein OXF02_02385 [Simkaniaceae bacterium]|nr:hypothetical protein [Simkaniaceae bacterium]
MSCLCGCLRPDEGSFTRLEVMPEVIEEEKGGGIIVLSPKSASRLIAQAQREIGKDKKIISLTVAPPDQAQVVVGETRGADVSAGATRVATRTLPSAYDRAEEKETIAPTNVPGSNATAPPAVAPLSYPTQNPRRHGT